MSDWKTVSLGAIATLRRDTVMPSTIPADTPYIGLEHIEAQQLRLNGRGVAGNVGSQKSRFDAGDILFGKLRPYFRKVVRPKFAGVCSTDIWVVRSQPNIDQEFLYYVMANQEFVDAANQGSGGTRMPRADWDHLKNRRIVLPSLLEQRMIARVLGAFDDKIELNSRISDRLEALARILFKAWFVDFIPFGGVMPKDWRRGILSEVASVNEHSIAKNYTFEHIEYIDIASVSEGKLSETTPYALADAPSRARRLVQHGDTIWSTVRPNRKSYLFVHTPEENVVVSTGFAVLTPREVPASYLYFWTTTQEFVDYLTYNADGSAYPAVLPGRFEVAPLVIPSAKILAEFEQQAARMLDRIAHNERENRTLVQMRDALLPRLLSGEIRIKENAPKELSGDLDAASIHSRKETL